MAEVKPLETLRYEPSAVGSLEAVIAPPYDVIDDELREQLLAQSPFNVVEIDLPKAPGGGDPYQHAEETFEDWRAPVGDRAGVRARASGACGRTTPRPTAARAPATGFFARVRVEEYGPGRIRPHERTHPGPKEDRLALTRATRANLSPIFSLFGDPSGAAREALDAPAEPFAVANDHEGTKNTLWRIDGHRRAAGRARRRRAADRRRPPPLRDRPRVRRGGRRRGPAPLRADVPRARSRTPACSSSPPTGCSPA